jgi:hypothetical protein
MVKIEFLLSMFFLGVIFLFISPVIVSATSVSVIGKARVTNSGEFLDFSIHNSNVKIDSTNGNFSGYAFMERIGWVAFGTVDNLTYGPVNVSLTTGEVTGKAKVINTTGYFDFTGNGSNVTYDDSTKEFSGSVWSEDVGWLDFDDTGVFSNSYLDPSNLKISIINPDVSPALSKTVTASTTEVNATLTMFVNNSGTTCDEGLNPFVAYADKTFLAEADNGKSICYKAVDLANNTTYALSTTITGIDRTGPIVSAGVHQHSYPNINRTFAGNSFDAPAGVNSNIWTKQGGTGAVTIGSSTNLTTTVRADSVGTFTLRLTSLDNLSNSTYSETQLIVNKTADYDNDGIIFDKDFAYLAYRWGTSDMMADFNGDGTVDDYDFAILGINWTN